MSTTVGAKDYVQSEFLRVEEEIILPHQKLLGLLVGIWDTQVKGFFSSSRTKSCSYPPGRLDQSQLQHNHRRLCYEIKGAGLSQGILYFLCIAQYQSGLVSTEQERTRENEVWKRI